MENIPILIDVIGLRCPMPVQKLRSMIKKTENWSTINMIGDDPESLHDIPTLLDRMNLQAPVIKKQENGWLFLIKNVPK
jgi:TusA-related sulfurtransferase